MRNHVKIGSFHPEDKGMKRQRIKIQKKNI